MEKETTICALCDRTLVPPFNRHHLIPVSKGGRHTETILLHKVCHDKIHAVFTEKELKRSYHTIGQLRQHEEMSRFISWIGKKEPQFYDKSIRRKK